ncbi:MAG: WalW protein [Sphingopyxis sp.]|nr:WalW protein [Sphingopyxis sp.]
MLSPPDPLQQATFPPDFGTRFLVTIDTEEDFDWNKPFSRIHHGLTSLGQLGTCQTFFANHGIAPLYLVDWPVINDPAAGALLRNFANSGKADVGAQLHPWVNPPFDEVVNARNSYTGNLALALQRAKMAALRDRIAAVIGTAPLAFRAGRYGLGTQTMAMLAELGFRCDTSVRAGFDYRTGHGPDYRFFPLKPWWSTVPGGVLELPLTTVFLGLADEGIYHRLARFGQSALSLASRLAVAERVALTPEGIPAERACAAIDTAINLGLPLLNFSFHSPSLAPGHTPYVTSNAEVVAFYAWWDQVLAHLDRKNVRPTQLSEVLEAAAHG